MISLNFDYSRSYKGFLYPVIKPSLLVLSHGVYKYRCEGKKNIPKQGALIIACNHVAFSDPALIVANCPRRVHFMAKSDLFENRAFSLALRQMNAFPVKRWTSDRKALRYALAILSKGGAVGIFPEGRRVRGEKEPVDARNGIGFLASCSGADILPCCIYKFKNGHRSELTLSFGEIIPNKELFPDGERTSASVRKASEAVMTRIKELWKTQEKHYGRQGPQASASE